MNSLEDRVVIVTGAGRGIGRAHALFMAAHGARVLVNDLGADPSGAGTDSIPAEEVAAEIRACGGAAVHNTASIDEWTSSKDVIDHALSEWGQLDAVVNNAGIVRDRMLVNMSEADFDRVVAVNQKGTFLMMRHAAAHWRECHKRGERVQASIVNTTSTSGLHSNPGQINYAAAKSAVATMSITAARELGRYGVRVNAIAPGARTRMSLAVPGLAEELAPVPPGTYDEWSPHHNAPLVAWLCTADCAVTGEVLAVRGRRISRYREWTPMLELHHSEDWTVADLDRAAINWVCRDSA